MYLGLFLYSFLISFVVAKVEINIEGPNGWAENLPTWKTRNRLTRIFFGDKPLTGYHVWMSLLAEAFIHLPFVVGLKWSLTNELYFQAIYFFAIIMEDFFWFILNPHYGFKKFNKYHARWHDGWVGPIPTFYVRLFGIAGLFFSASLFFGTK